MSPPWPGGYSAALRCARPYGRYCGSGFDKAIYNGSRVGKSRAWGVTKWPLRSAPRCDKSRFAKRECLAMRVTREDIREASPWCGVTNRDISLRGAFARKSILTSLPLLYS
ncbi:hypothetical protein L1887_57650 [Cichorium endivia]|nr:hypothetical protein L1887_57650 [Cichorium endivia]